MPSGGLPLAEDDVINLAWAYCTTRGRRHSCCWLRSFIGHNGSHQRESSSL